MEAKQPSQVEAEELKPTQTQTGGISGELRSRYTGCELNNGEMVITLISQGGMPDMGHSVVVFEWRDDGTINNGGSPYRKHKAFHLFPIEEHRSSNPFVIASLALRKVQGVVERTRTTNIVDGVPKSASKHKDGSMEDAQNRFLTHNATYRSWKVSFGVGWEAFKKAKEDWKHPPQFNLANKFGGMSCAGWAMSILAVAGIKPYTLSGDIGFPWPKALVEGGHKVPDFQ